jgi:hypothetical protein
MLFISLTAQLNARGNSVKLDVDEMPLASGQLRNLAETRQAKADFA